jgi:sugar phosphate isomerase/epimerase
MKLCYALRKGTFYPNSNEGFGELPPAALLPRYLGIVKGMGFEGIEIGVRGSGVPDVGPAKEQARILADHGIPAVCVRAGGPIAHPLEGPAARAKLEACVRLAASIGAGVVNTTFVTPATNPGGPGSDRRGERVSQGGSRSASARDFEDTARHLRSIGLIAADLGVKIAIEVHQGSIADNSRSTIHLLDLTGLDNVGANPDLGNVLWHYLEPEERPEDAIVALAPRSVYWHCKNLKRVYVPGTEQAIYLRVPLPDGDIDYRFAISAMAAAGYDGYLAVEGAQLGDQLTADGRSAAYSRDILASLD